MKFDPGSTLQLKKNHPCGSDRFTVVRTGMDVRLRCEGCGHEVLLSRESVEKSLKKALIAEE